MPVPWPARNRHSRLRERCPGPRRPPANLDLFPKVNSLVVNSDSSPASPTRTRKFSDGPPLPPEWAIGAVIDSPTAATGYCADGGTVVVTTASNVAHSNRPLAGVRAAGIGSRDAGVHPGDPR